MNFHLQLKWSSPDLVGASHRGEGNQEWKFDWEQFQKYFKDKYLSSQYYDNKRKEFHKLKLGQKSMEDHV